jgi:hypothetical protein
VAAETRVVIVVLMVVVRCDSPNTAYAQKVTFPRVFISPNAFSNVGHMTDHGLVLNMSTGSTES